MQYDPLDPKFYDILDETIEACKKCRCKECESFIRFMDNNPPDNASRPTKSVIETILMYEDELKFIRESMNSYYRFGIKEFREEVKRMMAGLKRRHPREMRDSEDADIETIANFILDDLHFNVWPQFMQCPNENVPTPDSHRPRNNRVPR